MTRKLPIFMALILATPLTFAQQQDEDNNELDEIVVTATRVPMPLSDVLSTTTVITAEDIEQLNPQSLGDLLSRKSGLGFRDSGGIGSSGGLFVRGTEDSQVLILIDGVRTASATKGATAIERIPLEMIERIEIVKGPMSGVYGADAIGGVIQIFTKRHEQEGWYGKVETTVGSNQLAQIVSRVGYGDGLNSVSVALTEASTDGIDRTMFKGGGNEDRDGYKRSSGSISIVTSLQENLTLQLSHVQNAGDLEYDNTSTSTRTTSGRAYVGENWHQQTELMTTSMRVEYEHSSELFFTGTFGKTTDTSKDIRPDVGKRDHFETGKFDYSIQTDLNLNAQNQLSLGIDYQKDKIDSNTAYSATKRTGEGYFALWQRQRDQFGTALNLRYDKIDTHGSVSNYNLQQSYDLSDQYQIVASYGTAFKSPSFNSLYYPGTGNPELKPEESRSAELSLRANLNDLDWQVSVYRTEVDNMIDYVFYPEFKAVNINEANLEGIEVEMTMNWGDYVLSANMDYLEAKDVRTGQFLDDRARASASFEIGRQIGNTYIGIDGFYEHSRFDRGKVLPDYSLFGVTGRYEIADNFSIEGHIDNLFDEDYVTNLASDDNPYQNEGRTIEVTLQYEF